MGDTGIGRAAVAALLGVCVAVAGPYALAGVVVTWQRIVMLSLLLACVALLVATVVLSMAAEMCARSGSGRSERVLAIADAFVISSAGMLLVTCVFSFVLAVIRMA